MAGPTPNYAIQHVLSTRSPREAALENLMMAIASLAPRFLLIAGIGVLGIVYFGPELRRTWRPAGKVDFEQILPQVVNRYLPIGCKGLILAGLLAAFMSTFVSTVNSGAAYIVNDIYKRYLDPHAPARRYVRPELPLLHRHHPRGHRLRLRDEVRALDHGVARLGDRAGVRHPERDQVALVAVQRLRLLRRHGRGHPLGPGAALHRQAGLHGPPGPGPDPPAPGLRHCSRSSWSSARSPRSASAC